MNYGRVFVDFFKWFGGNTLGATVTCLISAWLVLWYGFLFLTAPISAPIVVWNINRRDSNCEEQFKEIADKFPEQTKDFIENKRRYYNSDFYQDMAIYCQNKLAEKNTDKNLH